VEFDFPILSFGVLSLVAHIVMRYVVKGNDSGAPGSNTRQAQHPVRHCGLAAV